MTVQLSTSVRDAMLHLLAVQASSQLPAQQFAQMGQNEAMMMRLAKEAQRKKEEERLLLLLAA